MHMQPCRSPKTHSDSVPKVTVTSKRGAGTQWLVWKYESDSTLGDATSGALGPFPECLAPYFLRGNG